MNGAPRVSILLPAYQAVETLRACLRSVQRQFEPRWECVIVDDGSTDGTAELARTFARSDARFRLLSAPHGGLVATLNRGLAACRGRLVARMDADDLMHRERLVEQADLLDRNPHLVAVGCHVRLFPRCGLRDGRRSYERWINAIDSPERLRAEAFVECPVAHPALMIRRDPLLALGYRNRGWPEDYDLILRLLVAGAPVGVLPRRLLCWRDHPTRLSRTSPVYSLEQFTRCKAEFLGLSFLRDSPHYILWGHGGTGRALRRALRSHGKRPTHIVELHPGRLGQKIDHAPVIPPDRLPHVPRHPIVVSVAGLEARSRIRGALQTMGFRELRDYICAA